MQSAEDRQRDIFDSHRHRTFALAYYMTGSEIDAEKILTNTFVKVFSAQKGSDRPEPTAQDVDAALVGELKQQMPLGQSEPIATADGVSGANEGLAGRNVRRTDLEEAIQTLPPTERMLFLLRDVEGYTPAAIAKVLQMTEAQVNKGLFSARIRMRQSLVQGHVAGRQEAA